MIHTSVSALGWVVCCNAAIRAPQSSRVPNEPTGLARESRNRRAASYFFVKLSCESVSVAASCDSIQCCSADEELGRMTASFILF